MSMYNSIIDNAPFSALLLFSMYSLIFGNVLIELFGCRLQQFLTTNMYAKHLIAILLLFVFNISTDKQLLTNNSLTILFITLSTYIWFVLTTKMHFKISIFVILISVVIYILKIYIEKYEIERKNTQNDEILITIKRIKYSQTILTIILLVTTFIGNVLYYIEKKNEYNDSFTIVNFFIGKTRCRRSNIPIGNPKQ